ncbi:MAG: hypothetical protein KJ976_02560 [Proteobacteria bacterium]|nr:hypothetical protein [Pseudomonadota bacterium]
MLDVLIGINGKVGLEAFLLIALITVLQAAVFLSSLYIVWKIWRAVLDFIAEADTERARILKTILGHATVEGSGKGVKGKAIGVGLGATILILVLAVVAIWFIGHHTINIS